MSTRQLDRRRHIIVVGSAKAESFTSPSEGGPKFKTPSVDRAGHGATLHRQLERIRAEIDRQSHGVRLSVDAPHGAYLEFQSSPGFLLKLESLEYSRYGIELATTRIHAGKQYATVFVPQGRIAYFIKRVEKYLHEDHAKSGQPKNRALIESISSVRLAVAESFWSDPLDLLPMPDDDVWWEVWLRGTAAETIARFRLIAEAAGILVRDEHQTFPERSVVLVRGPLRRFAANVDLFDSLAELRQVRQIGSFFTRMHRADQVGWVQDLAARVRAPTGSDVAVTLLDTGVAHGHPLLERVLDQADVHACRPHWGVTDHLGHGTQMAGIAAFGDLNRALLATGPLDFRHRLESVKILPPVGANPVHLYGATTSDGVSLVEIQAPTRRRVFSLAVTATEADRGEPTAWSAEVDKLSVGASTGDKRLFLVSAGNIREAPGAGYPARNYTSGICEPAQAWNALSVGAFTDLVEVDEPSYAGWTPLSPRGGISPTSRTSCTWLPQWPIKPEIVMEGGNMAVSPKGADFDFPDSLSLLTAHHDAMSRYLSSTGGTSAAVSAAARYAAILSGAYPGLWPESIRALLVDSADWTPWMQQQVDGSSGSRELAFLLRCFGFGVPNLERALWSAGNTLTLIAQDTVQPFRGDRSNEMNLHSMPWPRAELERLGETNVELRITLSYFIEPNPARRGWKKRHRYSSHGLRFAVQKATESVPALRKRINKDAREDAEESERGGDSEGWLLKPNLRGRGSLHHDRWRGTAAELARRNHIAVYPAIGWWRERQTLGRGDSRARYSLVVTIRTPSTSVDIYQSVAAKLGVMVPVAT